MPPNPWPPVPEGSVRSENQDGISITEGNVVRHNLYDSGDKRPAIPSGDWKVRDVPHRPRDRGTT